MCIFLFSVVSFLNHLPVKLHILQRISLQPPLPGSLPSQNFLSAVRNTTFTSLSSRITPPPPPDTRHLPHVKNHFCTNSTYDTKIGRFPYFLSPPCRLSKQKCSLSHYFFPRVPRFTPRHSWHPDVIHSLK